MKYLTDYIPQSSEPINCSMKFYKCVSVDAAAWSGYELVYNPEGYYELSDVKTDGLSYSGMTPVIDSIYNADTTLRINAYYTNPALIPAQGLVLHVLLANETSTAETGQAITKRGNPTWQTVDGIPCVHVDNYSNSLTINSDGVPSGTDPATWSLWVKEVNGYLISMKNAYDDNGIAYVEIISFADAAYRYGTGVVGDDNAAWASLDKITDNKWHNIVMTRDEQGIYKVYCDGVLNGTGSKAGYPRTNGGFLALGYLAYYSSWGATGYVSNIRIYNRVLSQDEINVLASEFTPAGV